MRKEKNSEWRRRKQEEEEEENLSGNLISGLFLDFWKIYRVIFLFLNLHCVSVEKMGVESEFLGSNS